MVEENKLDALLQDLRDEVAQLRALVQRGEEISQALDKLLRKAELPPELKAQVIEFRQKEQEREKDRQILKSRTTTLSDYEAIYKERDEAIRKAKEKRQKALELEIARRTKRENDK